jgi:hypothetical protein
MPRPTPKSTKLMTCADRVLVVGSQDQHSSNPQCTTLRTAVPGGQGDQAAKQAWDWLHSPTALWLYSGLNQKFLFTQVFYLLKFPHPTSIRNARTHQSARTTHAAETPCTHHHRAEPATQTLARTPHPDTLAHLARTYTFTLTRHHLSIHPTGRPATQPPTSSRLAQAALINVQARLLAICPAHSRTIGGDCVCSIETPKWVVAQLALELGWPAPVRVARVIDSSTTRLVPVLLDGL